VEDKTPALISKVHN